jgi:hypothetical protein
MYIWIDLVVMVPQTLTTDQGTSFVAKEVRDFVNSYGIKLLNSSP